MQHYKKNNTKIILVPYELANKKNIEDYLKTKIYFPKKGEKKDLLFLANKNAKALFQKENTFNEKLLLHLQEILFLKNFPRHIECFDTSSLSSFDRVTSMVTFINGKRDKSKTKMFKIKTKKRGDIYTFYEVLTRHFLKLKEKNIFPDLIMLDGGKQHLNIAIKVLKELNIATVDIIAIAKEKQRKDKGLTKEKIFIPSKKEPIFLNPKSPLIFLLQRIRDISHITAISFHKKLRRKKISKSILDDIANIGPIKKKILLKKFKSIEMLKKASLKEPEKLEKITKKDAKNIFLYFKNL